MRHLRPRLGSFQLVIRDKGVDDVSLYRAVHSRCCRRPSRRSGLGESPVRAARGPALEFQGYWMGVDPVDGGDAGRSIVLAADGRYALAGRDTVFSLCDGTEHGIGTFDDGEVVARDVMHRVFQQRRVGRPAQPVRADQPGSDGRARDAAGRHAREHDRSAPREPGLAAMSLAVRNRDRYGRDRLRADPGSVVLSAFSGAGQFGDGLIRDVFDPLPVDNRRGSFNDDEGAVGGPTGGWPVEDHVARRVLQ